MNTNLELSEIALYRFSVMGSIIGTATMNALLLEMAKRDDSLPTFCRLLNIPEIMYSDILKQSLVWIETSEPLFYVGLHKILKSYELNSQS
jgi:hypothetical protein